MPLGGWKTWICSVLGSSRPKLPLPGLTLNQMMPLGSRVMPWELAALPFWPFTLNILTAPVWVSMRPSEVVWLGTLEVNQILPSRSAHESCTREPMREGVPCDQSLPSFRGYLAGILASVWTGTSYSLYTTRAASPAGRGRSLSFIELSPGPRARAR